MHHYTIFYYHPKENKINPTKARKYSNRVCVSHTFLKSDSLPPDGAMSVAASASQNKMDQNMKFEH